MRTKQFLTVLIVSSTAFTMACFPTGWTSTLGPTPLNYAVTGTVLDDSELLPPGSAAKVPVEGVRVEVLTGPEQGRHAFTDAAGRFDLGRVAAGSSVRASKAGWSTEQRQISESNFTPKFVLSEAPHCLWGYVAVVSRSGLQPTPDGVRVQVVDGPDAGRFAMTDAAGFYRIDSLSTQGRFVLEVSRDGSGTRYGVADMTRNRELYRMVISVQ